MVARFGLFGMKWWQNKISMNSSSQPAPAKYLLDSLDALEPQFLVSYGYMLLLGNPRGGFPHCRFCGRS